MTERRETYLAKTINVVDAKALAPATYNKSQETATSSPQSNKKTQTVAANDCHNKLCEYLNFFPLISISQLPYRI